MNVSERIDELLKERNMSRRQAALKAGIPPSSFQSAMQRNGSMTLEMLEKISAALDCKIADIISPEQEVLISIDIDNTEKSKWSGLTNNAEYFSAFMDSDLSELAKTTILSEFERSLSQKEFNEQMTLFKFGYLAAKGLYPQTASVFSEVDISPRVVRLVKSLLQLSPEDREIVMREISQYGDRYQFMRDKQGEYDAKKDNP